MNTKGTETSICAVVVPRLTRLGYPVTAFPRGPLVYFVSRGNAVKIGFSHRISKRIEAFKLKGEDAPKLLGSVPGGMDVERSYHERFAHLKIIGEWFRADSELLDVIAAERIDPLNPSWKIIARAFVLLTRSGLSGRSPRLITAQTSVGFWLQMMVNGETPDRIASLNAALETLEDLKVA